MSYINPNPLSSFLYESNSNFNRKNIDNPLVTKNHYVAVQPESIDRYSEIERPNNNHNSEEKHKIEFLQEINKRLKKAPSKKELLKKYNEKWSGNDSNPNSFVNSEGYTTHYENMLSINMNNNNSKYKESKVESCIDRYLLDKQNKSNSSNIFDYSSAKKKSSQSFHDISPERSDFDMTFNSKNKQYSDLYEQNISRTSDLNNSGSKKPNLKLNLKSLARDGSNKDMRTKITLKQNSQSPGIAPKSAFKFNNNKNQSPIRSVNNSTLYDHLKKIPSEYSKITNQPKSVKNEKSIERIQEIDRTNELYQQKSLNRNQLEKIKELQSQIANLTSINEEVKHKYERQLKSNMELKRNYEKLQHSLKKADDTERVKSLELKLDQTLVAHDSVKEDYEFVRRQFEHTTNELNESIIKQKALQEENNKLRYYTESVQERIKHLEAVEKKYNSVKRDLQHDKPMHQVLEQIGKLNEPLKNERFGASKPCINVDFSEVLKSIK